MLCILLGSSKTHKIMYMMQEYEAQVVSDVRFLCMLQHDSLIIIRQKEKPREENVSTRSRATGATCSFDEINK